MSRKTVFIILFLLANVVFFIGITHWRKQVQQQADRMLRDATRYSGATGDTITAFDNRTNRWIAEMKGETIETTLLKLTDMAEYEWVGLFSGSGIYITEQWREENYYCKDINDILSNRPFRKAFTDIEKTERKIAAELLTKNIRENLAGLRAHIQGHKDCFPSGKFVSTSMLLGQPIENSYRHTYYHPDRPPTHYGRRYAVLSYLLLASHFELQEVRPAVEEAIKFAKEEFDFFNSIEGALDEERTDAQVQEFLFKGRMLQMSIYRPSLLVTATRCDPTWNVEKKKTLEAKLITKELVDWESRALESDHDVVLGLIPSVPHDKMLKLRCYQGITEAEFDDFFGK